jgi:DNA-binding NtrC family response regulator
MPPDRLLCGSPHPFDVLVVESDSDRADALWRFFASLGCEVRLANRPAIVEQALANDPPRVLVIATTWRGRGAELIADARRQREALPILAVRPIGPGPSTDELHVNGATAIVYAPFEDEELAGAFMRILSALAPVPGEERVARAH